MDWKCTRTNEIIASIKRAEGTSRFGFFTWIVQLSFVNGVRGTKTVATTLDSVYIASLSGVL